MPAFKKASSKKASSDKAYSDKRRTEKNKQIDDSKKPLEEPQVPYFNKLPDDNVVQKIIGVEKSPFENRRLLPTDPMRYKGSMFGPMVLKF